ncbi:MAG: gamma-glutamyl-gamma-aminobutyrate hydrolase family protein [Candidatus Neomarinimicrobiota bacterium]
MPIKIGILNCYSDEPMSAPSAKYFSNIVEHTNIINICYGEKIENIQEYDGYIVSGSRSYHKDKETWLSYLRAIIKQIYAENIPCLAVCFGHQVVADMFGGTTLQNLAGEEGFQDVPTALGESPIKLFTGLPDPLKVYQSHNDAVIEAPMESIKVINNEKCVQYFQIGSIYSIQSHPEITVPIAIKLAKRNKKDIVSMLNGVNEQNIQSHKILKNFYSIVENS